MVKNNNEIAVIFKKKIIEGNILTKLIPVSVIEGNFIEDEELFMDKKGNTYFHLYEPTRGNSFGLRVDIDILIDDYPDLTLAEIKKNYLKEAKKYNYTFAIDDVKMQIVKTDKKTKEDSIFEDIDTFEMSGFLEYSYDDVIEIEDEGPEILTARIKNTSSNNITPKIDVTPKELYQELKERIIGQDEPIKKIIANIWTNYNTDINEKAKNIFINGSTGVGKTEIFRIISSIIGVPCVIEDANEFTINGYVGRNVSDMLIDLLNAADGDITKAERGILVIDEIDKLAANGNETVATKGVQQALLKLVEDGSFPIKNKNSTINFCTKKLLVVSLGAFSDIKSNRNISIGFDKNIEKEKQDITLDEIVKFGIIPEYVARFPVLVSMNDLKIEDLINILTFSKLSPLTKNKDFLNGLGIELVTEEAVINAIANEAYKMKLGARGLDTVINKILSDAIFNIAFESDMYDQLVIKPETIEDNTKYLLRQKCKR